MPLADSDIFKAQIYQSLNKREQKEFVRKWRELAEICENAHINIDDVFRYYTHVLRAREGIKSKEVGLRKFYADNKHKRLKENCLIDEITVLAKFWFFVNDRKDPDKEGYIISTETRKYFHCLSCYPNEFWKYITSVFFIKNKGNRKFDVILCAMLKELTAFLFSKFIEKPTVNAIKDNIYGACVSIQNNGKLLEKVDNKEMLERIKLIDQKIDQYSSSSKFSRAVLLLAAYLDCSQKEW